jgi:hypothetical protein
MMMLGLFAACNGRAGGEVISFGGDPSLTYLCAIYFF